MTELSTRAKAFCDWLDTIPPFPPFHDRPEFRFYANLSADDFEAARLEMNRRASVHAAAATDLEQEQDRRQRQRVQALSLDHQALDKLAAETGTPEEWLTAAILHLKVHTSMQQETVEVSAAAVSLVLMRLEEIEHGGEPWRGNAA